MGIAWLIFLGYLFLFNPRFSISFSIRRRDASAAAATSSAVQLQPLLSATPRPSHDAPIELPPVELPANEPVELPATPPRTAWPLPFPRHPYTNSIQSSGHSSRSHCGSSNYTLGSDFTYTASPGSIDLERGTENVYELQADDPFVQCPQSAYVGYTQHQIALLIPEIDIYAEHSNGDDGASVRQAKREGHHGVGSDLEYNTTNQWFFRFFSPCRHTTRWKF